jgi:hypothetical protein
MSPHAAVLALKEQSKNRAMGCWEIGALLLLVVLLFPKPFFRYASRWMKTVPRASSPPSPAAGDWVDACLDEEERLGHEDVPVWLGGVVAAIAAVILAWMSTHGGETPPVRAALGLALGLALLAAGLGVERFSGWFARCFHAAGISFLLVTLWVSVCRDGSIPPLLALAFLAVIAVTAAALLGRRPGAVALAIGVLAGAAVATPLDWKSFGPLGSLLILTILILLLPWGWKLGGFTPLALAAVGLLVADLSGPGNGLLDWIARGALVAGALLLARVEPYVQGVAWIGAGFAMELIPLAPLSPPAAMALALALAAAVWLAHRGAVRPARWTALAAISGLATFLLLALRGGVDFDWSGPALAASFLYLAATWLTARQGTGDGPSRLAVAPLAAATAAFAALAVALAIGRGWPGIAAALLTPLLAALAAKLRLPGLANLAIVTAILPLLCTLSRLDELGSLGAPRDTPWLLYGFGTPFLATMAAIWIARRGGVPPRSAARMEWVAAAAGMMLTTIMVRQLLPSAATSWLVAASLAPLLAFAAYRLLPSRTVS